MPRYRTPSEIARKTAETARSPRPDFSRRLARVIRPNGGPAAQLETLADAAGLIADLESWRQARPVWDHAAGLILDAATTGKKADVEAATDQIERALSTESWLRG